ncbi:MAG: hypothetical protein NTW29_15680 [Bacteroidetes bacterium]|nr:hypothetical protein [Bacteroidota bacterium]
MHYEISFSFLFLSSFVLTSAAQQVGIGTLTPHASAVLDISSGDKGLLPPRMSTAQRNAITTPAAGLLVFDTDKGCYYFFDGSSWKPLLFGSNNKIPPASATANDGQAGNWLGMAVDIYSNFAVVGAPHDTVNNKENQGSVYVFLRNGGVWTQWAKLTANDGAAGDLFGSAVAVYGDYVVVGAPNDTIGVNVAQGSVYIFRTNGINYTQQAKIVAADGAAEDRFGTSVAIEDATVLIGADSDDEGLMVDNGSAYVYTRLGNTWTQEAKFIPANAINFGQFGTAVSFSNNTAMIGAARTSQGYRGAAYFFVRSGVVWSQQAMVISQSAFSVNSFGRSLSIDFDKAVVGEREHLGNTGRAVVFERSGTVWTRTTTIEVPFPEAGDEVATAVCVSGDYLLLGAPGDKVITQEGITGAAYLYKYNGGSWNLLRKIEDADGTPQSRLGQALAIDGYNGFNLVIGAPYINAGLPGEKGKVLFLNVE